MPANDQFVDQIIADEGLDKPAEDENKDENQDNQDENNDASQDDATNDDQQDDTKDDEGDDASDKDDAANDDGGDDSDNSSGGDDTSEDDEEDEDDTPQEDLGKAVEDSKSYVAQLQANGYETTDEKGNLKPFDKVLPAGTYLLSKMEPVKVQDKNGKTHEFLTMRDLEEKFPDGFEAKNNIEQMKLQNGIAYNDTQFKAGVKEWNDAKAVYEQEATAMTQQYQTQESTANEYRAMAKEGLVPEVPKFKSKDDPVLLQSDAVKTLNNLLTYMDKKNKELQTKGLGQITSLYVAKQLMDNEKSTDQKKDKAKEIDQQRKETASLSKSGSSKDKEEPKKAKPGSTSLSSANYIEQVLAEEGLA